MTQQQILTSGNPVDLVSTLSLTSGTNYLLQPIGGTIRLAERAAATGDGAHIIRSGETWTVEASSVPIWVWSDTNTVSVVVTQA